MLFQNSNPETNQGCSGDFRSLVVSSNHVDLSLCVVDVCLFVLVSGNVTWFEWQLSLSKWWPIGWMLNSVVRSDLGLCLVGIGLMISCYSANCSTNRITTPSHNLGLGCMVHIVLTSMRTWALHNIDIVFQFMIPLRIQLKNHPTALDIAWHSI